jgi:hypothetical protein
MSFWDVVWFIVITFAFVAYLMVMFSIIGDLFRDREVSGGAKAGWVVALIFLPFLSSLLYLAVRGSGMADRAERSAHYERQRQEAYIRQVAGTTSPADQITQARVMLDSGTISQSEFEALKSKALV